MKHLIFVATILLMVFNVAAQTVITAADMPAPRDILTYNTVNIIGTNINLYDSGANKTWDYSSLTAATAQQADTFLLATYVNPLYGFSAPAGCYGYKVADSIPGLSSFLPVSIKQLYTFFNLQSNPSSYAAVAFGATVSGFPLASNYTTMDNWYFFPLSYGRRDSSAFSLDLNIPSFGGIKD